MDADIFLQQFGHLAQSEGGIKKLRDVILQLAVRGKLVEQNPTDEPAEVLLKKIEAEKKRLAIKDRISKTEDTDSLLTEIELPHNWAKALLGNVVQIVRGITFPAQAKETVQTANNIACLRTANVQKEVDWNDLIYVSREFVRNEEQIVQPNDILISLANSRELVGKTAIIKHRPVEATLGGFIGVIRPILIEPDFVNFFLCAPHVRAILIADASQTTNIANISGAKLNVITIPLPPLAEQKRIVAKVDELMALCDMLEAEQNAQAALKTQAVQSTLHHLTSPESPTSFGASLNILERTFGNWFDDLATVKHLRATILQLAVQGKLVPQNSSDEPASELLKRIETEKKRLVKEGKIKGLTSIKIREDVDAPHGWVCVSFGEIMISRDGERIPVSKEERNTRAKNYDYYGASGVIDKIDDYLFDTPLLLIGEDGANLISRSTPIAFIARGQYWVNNHAHVLDGISEDFLKYMELYINATDLKPYVTGTAQPKMNQAKMNSIPVLLPSEAEQKRIVAKVDELMTLCDQLEAHITHTQTTSTHLMDSLIHRMTEAA